jgi:hypothetical protein
MPPSRWCSSTVSLPPLKACLLILFYALSVRDVILQGNRPAELTLIWFGVSVIKMAELQAA